MVKTNLQPAITLFEQAELGLPLQILVSADEPSPEKALEES
jgi:hypothetical protein